MDWLQFIQQLVSLYIPSLLKQFALLCCNGWTAALDYRKSFFANLLQGFPAIYNKKVHQRKQNLFQDISTLKSGDPELAGKKAVRILEVGIGSGANLEFYPPGSHLIAVDPNSYFQEYFDENLKQHSKIILEKWVNGYGEDLSQIPSGSVDAVVTSLVLCSVQNLDKVFAEIQRVLAPGGRYYFMEHVNYETGLWKHTLLNILNFTRLWPLLFDGCHILEARRIIKAKLERHFSRLDQWNRFYVDKSGLWVFEVISPHISGVATK